MHHLTVCGAFEDYKFYAAPKSISEISKLIKCLSFAEKVNIHISNNGMKMTVEEAKCIQVCVFLRSELFTIFHLKDQEEDITIKISLKEMLECLKKMAPDGTKASSSRIDSQGGYRQLQFIIENDDPIFKMLLVEDAAITFFRMKVEEYDELIEFELTPVVVKIMMKAPDVWEYFKTLEDVSPDCIGLKVIPEKALIVSAVCNEGYVELVLPTTADAIESFECSDLMRTCYKLSNIKNAIKIMSVSSKCALKQDARGILCFSFLIEGETDNFVEYYCISQVPDDEEENDLGNEADIFD